MDDMILAGAADMALFARVVEAGSFTAAARAVGLSKSAVSRRVADLEARVGAQLLRRTTRRMHLTEIGAAFLERCQRVVAEVEDAEQAVSHLTAEPRGVLRVTAPVTFGSLHLARVITTFAARHPRVRVDVALEDRLVDLVAEGYDVAVRVSRVEDSSLRIRRLARCPSVLCASPAYLERRGVPARPEDLADHDCVHYHHRPSPAEWRFRGGKVVRVRTVFGANNGTLEREAALAGLGVIRVPLFVVGESLEAGTLVELLPGALDDELEVFAAYPATRQVAPKVRAFVDALADRFDGGGPWSVAASAGRSGA